MQFIDSHIHLQDYKLKDTPHFVSKLKRLGVEALICPSIGEKDWDIVLNFAMEKSLLIVPALGIHPWYLNNASEQWKEKLEHKLQNNPHALIGECGLDRLKNQNYLQQKSFFSTHIDLSVELSRPLLIHAVKSDMWLEEFWKKLKQTKFVFHSFSGSLDLMQKVISIGGYISFAPSVYKRSNCYTLLKNVPLEKLLVESDGPYQGSSSDIPKLINSIAEIKTNLEAMNSTI